MALAIFDPEGKGYDEVTASRLRKAYPLTLGKPSKYEGDVVANPGAFEAWVWHPELKDYRRHGSSLDERGMVLKGRGGPTFWMTEQREKELGSEIKKGPEGRYYSVKKGEKPPGMLSELARKISIINQLGKIRREKDAFKLKEKYPKLVEEWRAKQIQEAFEKGGEVGGVAEEFAKAQTDPQLMAMMAMGPEMLPMMDISRIQAFKKLTRVPEEFPHPSSGTTVIHGQRADVGTVIRGGQKVYQLPRGQRKVIWDMLQRFPEETLDFIKDIKWEAGPFSGQWRPNPKNVILNPSNLDIHPLTPLYETGNVPRTAAHEIGHAFEDYLDTLTHRERGTKKFAKLPSRYRKSLERMTEEGIHEYDWTQAWEDRPGEQFAQSLEKLMVGPHVKGEPWEWRYYEPPGNIQHSAMEALEYLQRRSGETPGLTRFHGWLKEKYPAVHKGYFGARRGYKKGDISVARYLKWSQAYDAAMSEWMTSLPTKLKPTERGAIIGPRIPPGRRPAPSMPEVRGD